MNDYVVTGTAAGGSVRMLAAVTTETVREAAKIHNLSPLAAAALGRTLTAASMMGNMMKGEKDTVTVQIKGDGPIGGIVAISDSKGYVRGYVNNPDVDLPLNEADKFDVAGAVGKGYLNVIKDMGLKEPYIGYVDLVSGEIAEDIAYYFAYSEQVPSVVALGVLVGPGNEILHAGGYLIQLMPGAEENIINYIENTISAIPSVSQLLAYGEAPEGIMDIIFGEKDLKIHEKKPCGYRCICSRERMERGLATLGRTELLNMLEEQDGAELQCHFCNSSYQFSSEEIRKLADSL